MKPAFFEDFALGRTEQIFRSFSASTWRDPEVVHALLCMADKQDSVVVLDNDAGGNSMLHIERSNV